MITGKLYPPIIGSTIPAFYQDDDDNLIIRVPFEHNRAVGKNDYSSIVLRLKTVQNDWICLNAVLTQSLIGDKNELVYTIPEGQYKKDAQTWYVNVGQYYKLQLAYIDNNGIIGYYSSIGITKFSTKPVLYIDQLETAKDNKALNVYKGIYSQKVEEENGTIYGDMTEKVYSYKFVIRDFADGSLIYDTGWRVHDNSTNEDEYESFDTFIYYNDLQHKSYITYTVQTNSGIVESSPDYTILPEEIPETFDIGLNYSFDDGYVMVNYDVEKGYVVREDENGVKTKIHEINDGETYFIDNTVEQGKEYRYYVYSNNGKSSRPQTIWTDYEDIFLSDSSGRQLKIRYNPSITQLRTNILENKLDTIGGKFPIFMKNGNVKYKTFSLSGLISYRIDENDLFLISEHTDRIVREETSSTKDIPVFNMGKEFYNERIFRDEVEAWLGNGEAKLFRSPSEGNMIIRLMGVSLQPYNNTQRLVYTFSATAVEIDNHDYEALIKHEFYNMGGMFNG